MNKRGGDKENGKRRINRKNIKRREGEGDNKEGSKEMR
jgi:hypothetical protein